MMIANLFNTSASIARPGVSTTNSYQEPTGAMTTVSTGQRCRIRRISANEQTQGNMISTVTHRVYFNTGVDVSETDQVVIGSTRYEVKAVNTNPGGFANHIECDVKEVRPT